MDPVKQRDVADRSRNESSIVSVGGIPVPTVEYPDCLIVFGGKASKETDKPDFIVDLSRR